MPLYVYTVHLSLTEDQRTHLSLNQPQYYENETSTI